jgi:hypothetical protein
MSDVIQTVETVLFLGAFCVGLPFAIVWGWVRWKRRPLARGVPPALLLIGFNLATASVLVGASSIVYAHVIGGFAFYDPLLLKIYRLGVLLSISGTLFASLGVRRSGPLRWHALCCSLARESHGEIEKGCHFRHK